MRQVRRELQRYLKVFQAGDHSPMYRFVCRVPEVYPELGKVVLMLQLRPMDETRVQNSPRISKLGRVVSDLRK